MIKLLKLFVNVDITKRKQLYRGPIIYNYHTFVFNRHPINEHSHTFTQIETYYNYLEIFIIL